MSHQLWWQLPGPRQFAQEVAAALREGVSVVLLMPEQGPSGVRKAIEQALSEQFPLRWVTLSPRGRGPLQALHDRFRPAAPARGVEPLFGHPEFAGRAVWVEMAAESWPAWRDFLADYEVACRSRGPQERAVFCVPLVGRPMLQPPPFGDWLASHAWDGAVSRFDMLLFAAHLFQALPLPRAQPLPKLHKQLAVAVTAELSLWDPAVAVRLAGQEVAQILAPVGVLAQLARERKWGPGTQPTRQAGTQGEIDGEVKTHSALLAVGGERAGLRELERRIWSAEVGVMLPYVEARRQELIQRLGRVLEGDFRTPYGVISDPRELEIGHIVYQISGRADVAGGLKSQAERLLIIRNALAHGEPLPPHLLNAVV
jgi:hypothetical protein